MDRDPRDQYYAIMQKYNKGHVSKNNRYVHYLKSVLNLVKPIKSFASSWFFVHKYYLERRKGLDNNINSIKDKFGNEAVKRVDFSEFVNVEDKYGIRETIKNDIEKTYGVKYKGVNHFDPTVSSKNVGVYQYDTDNRLGYWWLNKKLLNKGYR